MHIWDQDDLLENIRRHGLSFFDLGDAFHSMTYLISPSDPESAIGVTELQLAGKRRTILLSMIRRGTLWQVKGARPAMTDEKRKIAIIRSTVK
jgi:uncharacterized DUF497 family protein